MVRWECLEPPGRAETNSATPQVMVEKKYMGKLCGLCGNFDGKTDNEFLSEDGKLGQVDGQAPGLFVVSSTH